MSADNGLIVRKNLDRKIVVQYYSASADSYPPIENAREDMIFDNLDEAIKKTQRSADDTEYGYAFQL